MTNSLYHEKQKLGHCAVHALNNLFQEQWVDYDEMCEYARELHYADSPSCLSVNPYMSIIPYMGYFDISVIIKALASKRKGTISEHITAAAGIDALELSVPPDPAAAARAGASPPGEAGEMEEGEAGCVGFIVNVQQDSFLGLYSGRHWFSVLREPVTATELEPERRAAYWNLDSKLPRPICFASDSQLKTFLKDLINKQSAHIFMVSHFRR